MICLKINVWLWLQIYEVYFCNVSLISRRNWHSTFRIIYQVINGFVILSCNLPHCPLHYCRALQSKLRAKSGARRHFVMNENIISLQKLTDLVECNICWNNLIGYVALGQKVWRPLIYPTKKQKWLYWPYLWWCPGKTVYFKKSDKVLDFIEWSIPSSG